MLDRLDKGLKSKKALRAGWVGFDDARYVQSVAGYDFDVIVLDMQHGFHSVSGIVDSIQAVAHAGKSPVVRVPVAEWGLVERLMDFGALGVIAPMVNTKADAERFAQAAKYPQTGARSYSPGHAARTYGASVPEYLQSANTLTRSFAMIETQEAYDNLDEILSVDGIDGILMGPADFSISVTGNILPDVYGEGTLKQVADVAKRTRAFGKDAACFTIGPEHANLTFGLGYNLINIGLDQTYLDMGINKHLESLDF